MKITFLGDSLTWGGYGGNYVEHVVDKLPDHTIVNAGVGGDTVINLFRRLDEVLTDEPDFIFVMVGGNDANSYSQPKTRPYYKSTKKIKDGIVTPDDFVQTYRELLLQIQLQYIQPIVGLKTSEYNAEVKATIDHYSDLTREVAESLNVPILDFTKHLNIKHIPDRPEVDLGFIQEIGRNVANGWDDYETARQQWGYTYTFDGMHLLPETAERFAEIVADFLRDYLD